MKKPHYDFAFPLGIVCSCSASLRAAGLQFLSFPYDWITTTATDPEGIAQDMLCRVHEICDGFSNWFHKEDFEFHQHIPSLGKDQYYNNRLNLFFNHDFLSNIPFDEQFDKINAKYQRRCQRLLRGIRSAKRVMILHVDRPDKPDVMRADICQEAKARLEKHFTGTTFDFTLLSYEKDLPFEQRKTEHISDSITRITFDYRDYTPGELPSKVNTKLTGPLLASMFSVSDYRTPEEIRAHQRVKMEKRFKKLGVESLGQYYKEKILGFINGRFNPLPTIVRHLKQRRFEQIAVLGFNCECAFRFVCKWNFLDSSLFAWTNSQDLDNLTKAIVNFNGICAGEMELHEESKMWHCKNSNIYFHGKMAAAPNAPSPAKDVLDADLADLRGRVAHLKEKFLDYCTNEKSTLFVYKLKHEDAIAPDLAAKLDALEAAIEKLGAKNWQLLIVCEHAVLHRMPKGGKRVFRAVRCFNPGNNVTARHLGDSVGWNRIFTEFAPKHILQKKHPFKFES